MAYYAIVRIMAQSAIISDRRWSDACPKLARLDSKNMCEAVVLNGGRYWDRTSGPCRVKRKQGAYESTICERPPKCNKDLLSFDVT
jgi:hypothetical protein